MGSHRVQSPRKSWLVVGGIVMAIVVAGGGSTLALMRQSNPTPVAAVPAPSPVRTTPEPVQTPLPAFVPRTDEPTSTRANRPRTTTSKPRTTSRTTPRVVGKCTNQKDYSGDPRSNAEINSIGEANGYCPKAETAATVNDENDREFGPLPQSSGETQLKWLCQQGMIEEAACR